MKLNKTFGRIATTLVATAMLASVAAVPAFAVDDPDIGADVSEPEYSGITDEGTQHDADGIENFTFKKVLQLPVNVPVPNADFNFTLAGAEAIKGEEVRGMTAGNTYYSQAVASGKGEATVTATFNQDVPTTQVVGNAQIKEAEVTVNISLESFEFDDAGVYKYALSEAISDTTFAKEEYTTVEDSIVYLYVERILAESPAAEDEYKITGIVMMKPGTEYDTASPSAGKSDGRIVNTYLLDKDGNPEDNELTIEKQVAGSMSSPNDEFTFNLEIVQQYNTQGGTIDPKDPNLKGKNYYMVYEKKNAEGQYVIDDKKAPVIITSEKQNPNSDYTWNWHAKQTITLKHNERVRIYGLTDGQQCNIKELTSGDARGYSAEYTSNYASMNMEDATGKTFMPTFDKDVGNLDVTCTNTRDAVSPTGLVMDIAPYALLVIVAAAGCFVFLRKRRKD